MNHTCEKKNLPLFIAGQFKKNLSQRSNIATQEADAANSSEKAMGKTFSINTEWRSQEVLDLIFNHLNQTKLECLPVGPYLWNEHLVTLGKTSIMGSVLPSTSASDQLMTSVP